MGIVAEPLLAVFFEVVAGAVVDDEEHLSRRILRDEVLQEMQERLAVEHLGELI